MVATSDYGGKVLITYAFFINSTWIIYSGVTYHMTFDSRQISSLSLYKNLFPPPMVIQPQLLE